ncbi:hypothetical protein Hanom_Chr08g00752681 [Helianthus anomalus]
MNTLFGMKIIKKFPPDRKRFKGADGRPFVPKQLPAQFDPIDPTAVPEQVAEHEPDMYIPDLPQPRGPPGVPQFPRHVRPGPAPSYAWYQQLRHDVDRLTYVMEWLVEEAQDRRQREALPPRHFIPVVAWHQQQQHEDPMP